MYKNQLYILLLIFLNIGADQYTKYIVREKVTPGTRTEIVGELLQLMNVENSGAFLGMGSESNPTIKDFSRPRQILWKYSGLRCFLI